MPKNEVARVKVIGKGKSKRTVLLLVLDGEGAEIVEQWPRRNTGKWEWTCMGKPETRVAAASYGPYKLDTAPPPVPVRFRERHCCS